LYSPLDDFVAGMVAHCQSDFTPLAQTGLTAAGAAPAAQLIGAMVEGSFSGW